MPIALIRNRFQYFAPVLLICAALVYGAELASAQTTDSSDEKTHEAQPVSGTSPSGPAQENEQQQSTQTVICGPAHLGRCLKDVALDQAGIWTSRLGSKRVTHFGWCRSGAPRLRQFTMM